MLTALAGHLQRITSTSPWTRGLGAGRTLLALSSLLTLAFNTDADLFPLDGSTLTSSTCQGAANWGLFCVAGPGWGRVIAFVVLGLVLAGWRPRWTALPHWYVAQSVAATIFTVEGGDQLVALLTLLLLPALLTDPRRNHWHGGALTPPPVRAYVAHSALFVVRVQMAVVYLDASLGKLGSTEWADGTALYYWLSDPVFGVSTWAAPLMDVVLLHPLGTAALTWGTIVTEFALALSLFARRPVRRVLLVLGLALHGSIALLMGLVTFGLAMAGGLVLALFREDDWAPLVPLVRRRRSRADTPEVTAHA